MHHHRSTSSLFNQPNAPSPQKSLIITAWMQIQEQLTNSALLNATQLNATQCNSHYSLTTYLYASFISLLLTRCTIPTSQGVLFSQGTLGNHGALFWQSSHMYIHRRSVKARYLVKPWYLVMARMTCLNHVTSVKQGTLVWQVKLG